MTTKWLKVNNLKSDVYWSKKRGSYIVWRLQGECTTIIVITPCREEGGLICVECINSHLCLTPYLLIRTAGRAGRSRWCHRFQLQQYLINLTEGNITYYSLNIVTFELSYICYVSWKKLWPQSRQLYGKADQWISGIAYQYNPIMPESLFAQYQFTITTVSFT